MKKFFKSLLISTLLILGLGISKPVQATHLMGMDIQWKSVGNDTFEISLIIYRRCTDNATTLTIYPPTITSDSCSNSYTVGASNIVQISHTVDEITPVCKNQGPMCGGSSTAQIPFGVERHIIKYRVYLGGTYANCCWYKIYWEQQARNSNITTGYADADFYSYSWLNRCVQPQDNGPEFRNVPILIKCAGQDVCLNMGVFDEDGDSVSYDLAPPLGGAYNSPWSYTYPITCLGGNNPNPNATPSPTGFNLNPRTGDICFRPMQVQISVFKVMVTEWRKDTTTGLYRVIGKTARDMQIAIVQNCNNKLPSLSGPFSYEACADQQICITINTNDQDFADTTTIFWNKGIPNAQWNDNNGTVKRASGLLCWTPSESDASTLPYYFTATVNDDHCPLQGSTTRSYSITVKPTPKNNRTFTDKWCGLYEFSATPTSSYFNGSTYKWYVPRLVGTGSPVIVYSNSATTTYQFTGGGKFLVKSTMFFNGCTNTYFDTLLVDTPISVVCMPDSHICVGKNITITCDVKHGILPLRYQWSSSINDTFSTVTVSPLVSRYYKVMVIDSHLCVVSDSVFIDVKPLPVVSLPPDERLCYGDSFKIDAGNPGMLYVWKKDGSTISTNQSIYIKDSGNYTVSVTDSFGCESFDTFNLYVNPQVIVGPLIDVNICYSDTITLTESGSDSYVWSNNKNSTTITGSSISVNPLINTTYYIKGTKTDQGKTCYGYDTIDVVVNSLPIITFPTFPKKCTNGGYINLNSTLKVNGLTVPPVSINWYSNSQQNAIIFDQTTGNFYFDPMLSPASGGIYYVVAEALAPNGCRVVDSTTVEIVPKPYVTAGSDKTFCLNYNTCFKLDTMGQPLGGKWIMIDDLGNQVAFSDSSLIGPNRYSYCFRPSDFALPAQINGFLYTYRLVYTYKDIISPNCENSDTVLFSVTTIPIVEAGLDTNLCTSDGLFQLTSNLNSTPSGGKWYGTGVQSDSSSFDPNINTTGVTQTYTLYYIISRIGCSGLDSVKITVNPIPQPTISVSNVFNCKKDGPITLTSLPGGAGSRYFLDGLEIFSTTINLNTLDTGWHLIKYSYTNPTTKCSKDTTTRFYVEMTPHVHIDDIPGLCLQTAIDSGFVIYGHSYSPYGMQWINLGKGILVGFHDNIPTLTDSVIRYYPSDSDLAHGKIRISLISTGSKYCLSDTTYIEALIFSKPINNFTSTNLSGCVPFSTTFKDTNLIRDNVKYLWDFGDPTSSLNIDTNRNPTHIYTTPGIYTIKLIITSKEGCSETLIRNQYVEAYPIPKADFTFLPDSLNWATVAHPRYKFQDLSTVSSYSIESWYWNFGDGFGTSNVQNPEYQYIVTNPDKDTGFYYITLHITSKGGCSSTIIKRVYIAPDLTVYIPNAFTPDDNDINEKFKAVCTGVKSFQMYIFNRWGEKLYFSDNYYTHGWDGNFDQSACQEDVYIYKVIVYSQEDKRYEFDGTIHLIR